MSIFDGTIQLVHSCNCKLFDPTGGNLYAHASEVSWGKKGKEEGLKGGVDILIIIEFAEDADTMKRLIAFFNSRLKDKTWRIIPAVGCTPVKYEFNNDKLQYCKAQNTGKVIRHYSPKVILTFGAALYLITGSGNLLYEHFYSLHDDDTWLYSPEYACKVLPLPPVHLDRQSKELNTVVIDTYEKHFIGEQCRRAVRFCNSRQPRAKRFSYTLARDPDQVLKDINGDESIEWVAIDTETGGFDFFDDQLLTIQIAESETHAYVFFAEDLKDKDLLRQLFRDKKVAMHNATFDIKFLWTYGIQNATCQFDTMLASANVNGMAPKGLKALTWIYSDRGGYQDAIEKEFKILGEKDFRKVPEETLLDYAGTDAVITYRLLMYFMERLKAEPSVSKNFYEVIMPAVPMIADMERNGIPVNVKYMYEYSDKLAEKKREIESAIYEVAGKTINVSSKRDLSEVVRQDPNFKVLKDNKGKDKTSKVGDLILDKEAIVQYAEQGVEVAKYIVEYNHVAKTLSMLGIEKLKVKEANSFSCGVFTSDVDASVEAEDGFIASVKMLDDTYGSLHTSFRVDGTSSGRLASSGGLTTKSKINGQNFTKVLDFRKMFDCSTEYVLLQMDYSAMEMRIASQVSGPGVLEELQLEGMDMHCYTASKALQLQGKEESYESVYDKAVLQEIKEYKEIRTKAKPVNFGAIYGATAPTVANTLNIPVEEAQGFLDAFFAAYPEYKRYMEDTTDFVKTNGYVDSLLGKRRRFPQLTYCGRGTESKLYRKKVNINGMINSAINHRIQSTSGHTTLLAMTNIYKDWKRRGMKSKIVINVHDSIGVKAHVDELEYVYDSMRKFMKQVYYENVGGNKVTHDVDCEVGHFGFGKVVSSKEELVELVRVKK